MDAKSSLSTTAGSTVISALWTLGMSCKARHPELPDVVVVIIGSGKAPKEPDRWGHHWPERWMASHEEQRTAEVFVAGELLALGGPAILETLLHEAAHALS